MATQFGIDATRLSEPTGAGSQPIQGVETPASQYTLPTGILNIGVQVAQDVYKKEQDKAKELSGKTQRNLLSSYTRTQTGISQSNLSIEEKTARMNAEESKYLLAATEMGIVDEFKKVRDLLTSGGTTGAVLSKEKLEREEYKRNVAYLQGNDIIVPPGADPSYVQGMMDVHARTEAAIKAYDISRKKIEDTQNDTKYSQSQKDRLEQEAATGALNQIGGLQIESFNNQAKTISNAVLAGTKTEEEARSELASLQARYITPITALSDGNATLANTWSSQFTSLAKAHLDIITSRGESGQRTIDQALNTASIIAAQNNPELVALASVRPWLGDNPLTGQILAEQLSARILPRLVGSNFTESGVKGHNIVGDSDNKSSEIQTYSWIRSGVRGVQSGMQTVPGAKEGYFQATNNILSMLGDKNPGSLSATDLTDVAGFMLSPEFVYVVKEGGLNPSAASAAARVFKQDYSRTIDGNIRNALEAKLPVGAAAGPGGTSSFGIDSGSYLDVVDISFRDGKVRFLPKASISETANPQIISQQIRNNLKDQEQALNQTVRLAAHLEGRTDYQAFWEEKKSELMPYVFGDEERLSKPVVINGVEWEYIGPPGGNTRDRNNWRQVNGRTAE